MTRREIILQLLCENTNESREFFEWALQLMSQGNNEAISSLDEDFSEEAGKELMRQMKDEINDMKMLFSQMEYAKTTNTKEKIKKEIAKADPNTPCYVLPAGITVH